MQGRRILATETAESAEDLPDVIAVIAGIATGVARKDIHLSDLLMEFVSRGQLDCNRFVTIAQAVNVSNSYGNLPHSLDFRYIPVYNSIYTYSPGNGAS